MKYIFIFLLLIPLANAVNITIDYPTSTPTNEEIKFDICIINSSELYDLKIDIFQNEKRISRILNDNIWTSSMYYVKNSISECSDFYVKINEDILGIGEITVKIRDSKNKVLVFFPYFIDIEEFQDTQTVTEAEEEHNEEPEEKTEEKTEEKKKEKEINEKDINFSHKPKEIVVPETIILSPKAFNTNKDSKKSYTDYTKYSFILFCIVICVLYITKPRKKENEFR